MIDFVTAPCGCILIGDEVTHRCHDADALALQIVNAARDHRNWSINLRPLQNHVAHAAMEVARSRQRTPLSEITEEQIQEAVVKLTPKAMDWPERRGWKRGFADAVRWLQQTASAPAPSVPADLVAAYQQVIHELDDHRIPWAKLSGSRTFADLDAQVTAALKAQEEGDGFTGMATDSDDLGLSDSSNRDVHRAGATVTDPAPPAICGVVSLSGPNGEPLACGYVAGHSGAHSWASLPTWTHEPMRTDVPIGPTNEQREEQIHQVGEQLAEGIRQLVREHYDTPTPPLDRDAEYLKYMRTHGYPEDAWADESLKHVHQYDVWCTCWALTEGRQQPDWPCPEFVESGPRGKVSTTMNGDILDRFCGRCGYSIKQHPTQQPAPPVLRSETCGCRLGPVGVHFCEEAETWSSVDADKHRAFHFFDALNLWPKPAEPERGSLAWWAEKHGVPEQSLRDGDAQLYVKVQWRSGVGLVALPVDDS